MGGTPAGMATGGGQGLGGINNLNPTGALRTLPNMGVGGNQSNAQIPLGAGAGGPGQYVQLNNVIQIDGKTLARQMAKYKLDAQARE